MLRVSSSIESPAVYAINPSTLHSFKENSMQGIKNIVLVHGAWEDGS
jgi:hypothetical protein